MKFFHGEKRALCNRKKGTCQNLGGLAPLVLPPVLTPLIMPPKNPQHKYLYFIDNISKSLSEIPEIPEVCYQIFYGHFCRGPLKFGGPPSLDTLTPSRYATGHHTTLCNVIQDYMTLCKTIQHYTTL